MRSSGEFFVMLDVAAQGLGVATPKNEERPPGLRNRGERKLQNDTAQRTWPRWTKKTSADPRL